MSPVAAAAETEIDPRRAVTLERFLGNDPVREYLARSWQQGQLPQALLISGPEGIGKTTLAYGLMRRIAAGPGDPETEHHAKKVERGTHPDMIAVTGKDSASAQILVGEIRELEERIHTAPLEASHKMALIEPADRMNASSANALLKVLEEPPPRLIFFLITSEPNRLLPTIRSRCASIELQPVAREPLTRWLVDRHKMSEESARLAALLAEGRPGRALRLGGEGILARRERLLATLGLLRAEGFAILFKAADGLLGAGGDLEETLLLAVALLRDALTLRLRGEGVLNSDLRSQLEALAGACSPEGLLESAQRIETASREARYFYTPQARAQFVEMLLIDVGRLLRAA
jgi:DNA polymerase-3 subunit delta'